MVTLVTGRLEFLSSVARNLALHRPFYNLQVTPSLTGGRDRLAEHCAIHVLAQQGVWVCVPLFLCHVQHPNLCDVTMP